jgi:hypothetical protein
MTDANRVNEDDPVPGLKAELESLIQSVYGHRLEGARLGMALGRISSLRRQLAILEQGRSHSAQGTHHLQQQDIEHEGLEDDRRRIG